MADETRRGLPRPQAPVDIFTLQPEPDLVQPVERPARRPTRPQPQKRTTKPRGRSRKKKSEPAAAAAPAPRIKTSVELSPESLDLISRLKSQHRRRTGKHWPMWRILEEAIEELAARRLE